MCSRIADPPRFRSGYMHQLQDTGIFQAFFQQETVHLRKETLSLVGNLLELSTSDPAAIAVGL
jgi:hypothetical protein